jgi:hypothetical protein
MDDSRPKCKLSGEDGNVFNIIGSVAKALKKADYEAKAKEFIEKAFNSKSYDAVLVLAQEYVDIE